MGLGIVTAAISVYGTEQFAVMRALSLSPSHRRKYVSLCYITSERVSKMYVSLYSLFKSFKVIWLPTLGSRAITCPLICNNDW